MSPKPCLRGCSSEIHDHARATFDQELIPMRQLLLAANADEDAGAGAEVGEDHGAGLFFDQAVLLGDERIVGEHQIAPTAEPIGSVLPRATTEQPSAPPSNTCVTRNDDGHLGDE